MDPKFIFVGFIVFVIISVLNVNFKIGSDFTTICNKKFNETCIKQNECCSHNSDCCTKFCHKFLWFDNGRCVDPSLVFFTTTVEPDPVLKCKSFGDNTCGNNHECCSLNCYKEHSWKLGVCKKASDHVLKYDRSGLCSFYQGDGTTANGEPFRQSDMTAAHRTLPFNTTVRVASGNRSVVVRVNDRGPFVKGRILDMSKGAAEKLGILTEGVVPCELTVLSPKIVCKKDWDNTCVTHDECCSQNCDKQPKWKHGVCKPAVVL